MHPRFHLLFAILAGVCATLSLAPFDIATLAVVSSGGLYALLTFTNTNRLKPKGSFLIGWCFGIGLFGSGASWIYVSMTEHSNTPAWLAILLTSLFVMALALLCGLQTFCYARLTRYASKAASAAVFIGLWVLFEWFRSFLFTGFPWLYVGYAILDTPWQTLAPIGGVWLGTAWLVSFAVIAVHLIASSGWFGKNLLNKAMRIKTASALSLLLLLPFTLTEQWTRPVLVDNQPKQLQIALIQANIDQNEKWRPDALPDIIHRYQTLSAQHTSADIIIWPETAIPALFSQSLPLISSTLDSLDRQGSSLIAGMPVAVKQSNNQYHYFNSLAVLSGGIGIYHKQQLVPFGEYLPFDDYLRGLIDFFNLPMSNFRLPSSTQTPLTVKGHIIAASICYEIAYPALIRKLATQADWMLTVSNDTWFGHSIAPDQHHQIARMRALENGRWLVRSTNNGISTLIDPLGQVQLQLARYQKDTGQGLVTAMSGYTPYQQWGHWVILCLALLTLILPAKALILNRRPS